MENNIVKFKKPKLKTKTNIIVNGNIAVKTDDEIIHQYILEPPTECLVTPEPRLIIEPKSNSKTQKKKDNII